MTSSLTADRDALVLKTPYNPMLVAALKQHIPAAERQWDGASKAWRIAPQHGATAAALVTQYLGEQISVPQIAVSSAPETRFLDVRYIGACKERGAGERLAFGWSEGRWSVILPEPALRKWFLAEARPDEETTLYGMLGISPTVTPDEVKKAYRRLALQWHPDRCREPDAAEQFRRIQHAWEILGNARTRGRYDAGLALAQTLQPQNLSNFDVLAAAGYRSPLRCGWLVAEGRAQLGRFVVTTILGWEDITDAHGRTLSVSWPAGADTFLELWL